MFSAMKEISAGARSKALEHKLNEATRYECKHQTPSEIWPFQKSRWHIAMPLGEERTTFAYSLCGFKDAGFG